MAFSAEVNNYLLFKEDSVHEIIYTIVIWIEISSNSYDVFDLKSVLIWRQSAVTNGSQLECSF
jgi:hypothetical protein